MATEGNADPSPDFLKSEMFPRTAASSRGMDATRVWMNECEAPDEPVGFRSRSCKWLREELTP